MGKVRAREHVAQVVENLRIAMKIGKRHLMKIYHGDTEARRERRVSGSEARATLRRLLEELASVLKQKPYQVSLHCASLPG